MLNILNIHLRFLVGFFSKMGSRLIHYNLWLYKIEWNMKITLCSRDVYVEAKLIGINALIDTSGINPY